MNDCVPFGVVIFILQIKRPSPWAAHKPLGVSPAFWATIFRASSGALCIMTLLVTEIISFFEGPPKNIFGPRVKYIAPTATKIAMTRHEIILDICVSLQN